LKIIGLIVSKLANIYTFIALCYKIVLYLPHQTTANENSTTSIRRHVPDDGRS
jgi:hypothetical protein